MAENKIVVKISSDITDKKLFCGEKTTAKELALQFAEKANVDVKGKKIYLKNGNTGKIFKININPLKGTGE